MVDDQQVRTDLEEYFEELEQLAELEWLAVEESIVCSHHGHDGHFHF